MRGRNLVWLASALCLSALVLAGGTDRRLLAQEADKVYRNLSADQIEKLLGGMKITPKKTNGPKEGVIFYDFARTVGDTDYQVRLHSYQGKDLWIDAVFNDKVTLATVNGWNIRAKFSRAVLVRDKKADRETVSLESQIDCTGGITQGMVRQFITRFDGEIRDFVKYLSK